MQYLVRRNVMMEQTLVVTASSKKEVKKLLSETNARGETEIPCIQICELECIKPYPAKHIEKIDAP